MPRERYRYYETALRLGFVPAECAVDEVDVPLSTAFLYNKVFVIINYLISALFRNLNHIGRERSPVAKQLSHHKIKLHIVVIGALVENSVKGNSKARRIAVD